MNVSPLIQAIGLVMLSGFVLSVMDSLGKVLMHSFAMPQVTWARFFFHAVFVSLFFVVQKQYDFLIPKAPWLQLLRGLSMIGVTSFLYLAIKAISLAEATAIIFLSPIFVTLLAGIFLHEKIRLPHIIAVVLGFIGILIITRPDFEHFDMGMLWAFIAAMILSTYFLLTSMVRFTDNPRTSLFYASIVGAVILTLVLPLWWTPPTADQWVLLVCMGLLGAIGHFLLIRAYSLVNASTISPYLNGQVLAATLYSIFIFGDILHWNFYLGSALIVIAGVYLWASERYARKL